MANPDETPRSDPWQMRASDADREKYVSVLQNAYAEGRLSHDEYDDRMSTAYQAVTFADLYPLLTDLPVDGEDVPMPPGLQRGQLARVPEPETAVSARAVTVDTSPAVAVFSEVRRGGRWVVPAEQTSIAVMGTLKIDLRQALLESGSVRIQAVAVMGEIRIKVPDDVHVEVTGTGVFGEFVEVFEDSVENDKHSDGPRIDAPAGAPRVHITGAAIFGSVTVIVVPSREDQGGRVLPATGRELTPPPANLPPANLPPAVLPPSIQPPPNPPARPRSVDGSPPVDGGPPGDQGTSAAEIRGQNRGEVAAPAGKPATPPLNQLPAMEQLGHSESSEPPDVSGSTNPGERGGPDERED